MANANTTDLGKQQPPHRIQTKAPTDARPHAGTLDVGLGRRRVEAEIAEIDMIGKKLAHAIVAQREQRGGFQSWEELREVQGLDAMKIAELQRATHLE